MIHDRGHVVSHEPWQLLDQLRGWPGRTGDLIALVAGLLYAEVVASEAETVASFARSQPAQDIAADQLSSLIRNRLGGDRLFAPVTDVFDRLIRESPRSLLAIVLDWLRGLDIVTPDGRAAASDALELLVIAFAEREQLGEYYTPVWIAEFMAALADIQPGQTVCDPCFGMGGLLAAATRRLASGLLDRSRVGLPSPSQPFLPWQGADRQPDIFGAEINVHAYLVGLARVVLAGGQPELLLGDALANWQALSPVGMQRFDCVLVNPPWGSRSPAVEPTDLPVPTRSVEGQFVQRALLSLKPGGRAVIATSMGLLFRSGAEARIRRWISSEYCLEGILSLPRGAFRPFAGTQGSILVIRKARPASTVRVMDVPRPGVERVFASLRISSACVQTQSKSLPNFVRTLPLPSHAFPQEASSAARGPSYRCAHTHWTSSLASYVDSTQPCRCNHCERSRV